MESSVARFILPAVVRLLLQRGPSAIGKFVVAVKIRKSVKCLAFGAWTHIAQKSLEAIFPFVTHRYSATAIIRELSSFRIEASRFSIVPRRILSRCLPALPVSVGNALCSGRFVSKAAAARRMPGSQMFASNDNGISTITLARPCNPSTFRQPRTPVCGDLYNNQSSKALLGQVNQFHGAKIA